MPESSLVYMANSHDEASANDEVWPVKDGGGRCSRFLFFHRRTESKKYLENKLHFNFIDSMIKMKLNNTQGKCVLLIGIRCTRVLSNFCRMHHSNCPTKVFIFTPQKKFQGFSCWIFKNNIPRKHSKNFIIYNLIRFGSPKNPSFYLQETLLFFSV